MSFGFRAINNGGSVTISSENKVLVYSQRGGFLMESRFSNTPGYGFFNFAKAVNTYEPPQVFVRIVSTNTTRVTIYMEMVGSPNNWTGCIFHSAATPSQGVLQRYEFEYVICHTASRRSSQKYGMEIFNEYGAITYSSDTPVVRYGKFTKNWTNEQGSNYVTFKSGISIDSDDFVTVSWINRGLNWMTGGNEYVGCTVYDNGPVFDILWQKSSNAWYWQLGGTSFSLPICKFPTSRYNGIT